MKNFLFTKATLVSLVTLCSVTSILGSTKTIFDVSVSLLQKASRMLYMLSLQQLFASFKLAIFCPFSFSLFHILIAIDLAFKDKKDERTKMGTAIEFVFVLCKPFILTLSQFLLIVSFLLF